MPSIEFMKESLFLNVSEEEATVMFRGTIADAKKQWYRPWDNLAHIYNDEKKAAKLAKQEKKLEKKLAKQEKERETAEKQEEKQRLKAEKKGK